MDYGVTSPGLDLTTVLVFGFNRNGHDLAGLIHGLDHTYVVMREGIPVATRFA
jgi:hypothetical protein